MLTNNAVYKYEMPYNGIFVITQCWNNDTVKLQCVATKTRHKMRLIKIYTYDTSIEDI